MSLQTQLLRGLLVLPMLLLLALAGITAPGGKGAGLARAEPGAPASAALIVVAADGAVVAVRQETPGGH